MSDKRQTNLREGFLDFGERRTRTVLIKHMKDMSLKKEYSEVEK